jgi:hypothetical protein
MHREGKYKAMQNKLTTQRKREQKVTSLTSPRRGSLTSPKKGEFDEPKEGELLELELGVGV